MRISFVLSLMALPAAWAAAQPQSTSNSAGENDLSQLYYIPNNQKPRVFVCTDILNEPDDQESVVRYLLYSNQFNTRALCTTTSTWLRNSTHPEAVQHIVNAYRTVVNNLNQHVHPQNQYAPADIMTSLITSGPTVYGKAALEQPLSDGASLLIERLQESEDPLWDDTGEWIRNGWPDIFWIASIHTFGNYDLATWQGMWTGLPDMVQKVSQPWIGQNIQVGPLGAVYPSRNVGAESDTPSFLCLIQNGLGDRDHPGYGSWGGRYGPINIGGVRWADTEDTFYYVQEGKNETSNKATVARWRDHFQNDIATRMQWTLSPSFADGVHPPVPRINGTAGPAPIRMIVTPGSQVVRL
ncbi:uncharacterized protein Z518_07846 [Rhinocladiella mackenziei CBS 650.93]|uniref:Rhinocladiella mackenziei CBS 650.93 unplaced genomic scaffold supercont1.6, whole genome shotgun sequence n=1 Tax=Rhinocladiella mackenziei CBS 650.93 TaxID=1442369 RepID=A0A0D2FIS1_9EURO|nr:uncharacterized protein Z518_07846 [Rhinocladiella mackenziei CBS 650.93]KIX01907.1 hypothetical protein Z518_07846 [Rhinocladiella mackenziei CBS 650.93]